MAISFSEVDRFGDTNTLLRGPFAICWSDDGQQLEAVYHVYSSAANYTAGKRRKRDVLRIAIARAIPQATIDALDAAAAASVTGGVVIADPPAPTPE